MKSNDKSRIASNSVSLLIFQVAKIVFPFITLPYLTRVLSTESYGVVAYVKTVMIYLQVFVDFGFALSATKDIARNRKNINKLNSIVSDTILARLILGVVGFFITVVVSLALPILRENIFYTILSYVTVFISVFLMDFLFRGIEKMHVIAIRFVTMKTISTILTFLLVKDDYNLILIPILDIVSSIVAVILIAFEVRKLNVKIYKSKLNKAIKTIKESLVYFASNVASTSFNAFSTIMVGVCLTATDVAYWGVCMQIIGAIQACFTPFSEGLYPEMVRTKNLGIFRRVLFTILPLIAIGCALLFFMAEPGIEFLGGENYKPAVIILQILTPCLFFSFLAIMYGWPALGAIDRNKEVTISTIVSVVVNVIIVVILIPLGIFSLINIAIVRVFTEFMLFVMRYFYFNRYKKFFKLKER